MRTLFSMVAAGALQLVAVTAQAQAQPATPTSDAPEDALAHFRRGLELHEEHDLNGALVEFRRAYELAPTYKVLYNIGQVCFELNDYACALRSFEKYLAEGSTKIASERRTQVQRDIDKLHLRVGQLEIVTNVPDVDISIDDVHIGKTPLAESVVVSAGKRRIVATKEGRIPITRIIDVGGTDSQRLQLDLVDATVRTITVTDGSPVTPSKFTTLSWIGIGAAAALGATAGVTGALALSAEDDLANARFSGDTPSDDALSKQSTVRTLSTVSDVFLGAAVLTLGTTLVLTLTRQPKAEAPKSARRQTHLGVAKAGFLLGGAF